MLGKNRMLGDESDTHISFSYSSDEDFIPSIMKKKEKKCIHVLKRSTNLCHMGEHHLLLVACNSRTVHEVYHQ